MSRMRNIYKIAKKVYNQMQYVPCSVVEAQNFTERLMSKRKEYKELPQIKQDMLKGYIFDMYLKGGKLWIGNKELVRGFKAFVTKLVNEGYTQEEYIKIREGLIGGFGSSFSFPSE